jgi:sugar phosphate isomerase/epimerase
MNIEEVSLVAALRDNWERIGHIHWADSNRSAMGMGHTDSASILQLLREMSYKGYVSAEVFPLPTGPAAAQQTINSLSP